MLVEPRLSEKQWDKIKASVITATAVGAIRLFYGVTKDVLVECIRRGLGWVDDDEDDAEDEDGAES